MTDRSNKFPGDAGSREAPGGVLPAIPSPGSPKRRPVPPHLTVTVAILQAEGGIKCPLCTFPLTADNARILEHMVPVKLGGGNTVDNLRWVHKACADRKTNGNAATAADGDLHKIAKAKRLAKAQEVHEAVLAGTHKRPPSRIKSRGFAKVHRPFRRVERG